MVLLSGNTSSDDFLQVNKKVIIPGIDKTYNGGFSDCFFNKYIIETPKIPKLDLSKDQFEFECIEEGEILKGSFKVTNSGERGSVLEASLSTDETNLKLNKKRVSLDKNESETIQFTIQTKGLGYNKYRYRIDIDTNESSENTSIDISFTVKRPDPVLRMYPSEIDVGTIEETNPEAVTINIYNKGPEESILEIKLKEKDDYIQVDTHTLSIPSSSKKSILLTFDVADLKPGQYKSLLNYTSNDPDYTEESIPIMITIQKKEDPKPTLRFEPHSINHECFIGQKSTCSFSIENDSHNKSVLEIKLESFDAWFSFQKDSFQIQSGEKETVVISFHVQNIQPGKPVSSHFTIISNDPTNKEVEIPITLLIKPNELIIQLQIGNSLAYVQEPGEKNRKPIRLDAPPTIVNGRTVVPLRFLAETFGAEVRWLQKEEEIQMRYEEMLIHLWLHRKYGRTYDALIEQPNTMPEKVSLQAPPCVMNGRTMVPLRFIGETFGASLDWDAASQTITLRKERE